MLNAEMLSRGLSEIDASSRLFCYETTDSTNTRALEYARGLPEGTSRAPALFLADGQTLGRGRRGRSFVSRGGEGIYMTLLFYPESDTDAQRITARCAVAFRRALKRVAGVDTSIKWVNDLYARTPLGEDKKLAGILAEAVISPEGGIRAIAVGIGVNVYREAVSEEISEIATSIEEVSGRRVSREELILELTREFYEKESEKIILAEYRAASLTVGQKVTVYPHGGEPYPGFAEDIGEDYSLLVRREDGSLVRVFSGEVSAKPEKRNKDRKEGI